MPKRCHLWSLAYRMPFILKLDTISASRHHSAPLKVKGHVETPLNRFHKERPLVRMGHCCGGRSYVSIRSSIAALSSRWRGHRLMLHDCVLACKGFSTPLFYLSKVSYFLQIFIISVFFYEKEGVPIHLCEKKRGILFVRLTEGSVSMYNKYGLLYICLKSIGVQGGVNCWVHILEEGKAWEKRGFWPSVHKLRIFVYSCKKHKISLFIYLCVIILILIFLRNKIL